MDQSIFLNSSVNSTADFLCSHFLFVNLFTTLFIIFLKIFFISLTGAARTDSSEMCFCFAITGQITCAVASSFRQEFFHWSPHTRREAVFWVALICGKWLLFGSGSGNMQRHQKKPQQKKNTQKKKKEREEDATVAEHEIGLSPCSELRSEAK